MKAAILFVSALCAAQVTPSTGDTGQRQLLGMRAGMGHTLKSLPNYVCLQSTERLRAPKSKAELRAIDGVELEVAHVGDKEMYSLPGRNMFADSQLQTMLPSGLVGTGAYASQMIDILFGPGTRFRWVGPEMLGERKTLRWDFTVPKPDSDWRVGNAKRTAQVGSEGSIWADAGTLAVVRMSVHATQFPARFPLKSVTRNIDYAAARIGARNVLLPSVVEDVVQEAGGALNINRSRFGHCREYTTTSTLLFDGPAAQPAQAQPGTSLAAPPPSEQAASEPAAPPSIAQIPSAPAALPPNLHLKLGLDAHLRPENAVIGMAVNAHLLSDVRFNGKLLAPKGTPVHGVLKQYAKLKNGITFSFTLTIDFNEIVLPGGSIPFRARLKTIDTPVEGLDWLSQDGTDPMQSAPLGLAVLIVKRQPSFHLYPGTPMTWVTFGDEPNSKTEN